MPKQITRSCLVRVSRTLAEDKHEVLKFRYTSKPDWGPGFGCSADRLRFIHLGWLSLGIHNTLDCSVIDLDPVSMKLSTVLTAVSAAIASSGNIGVPDISDHPQDLDITGGTLPPTGEKIPGENSFSFCKGDRSYDAVCIELRLLQSPALYPGSIWSLPEQCSLSTSS